MPQQNPTSNEAPAQRRSKRKKQAIQAAPFRKHLAPSKSSNKGKERERGNGASSSGGGDEEGEGFEMDDEVQALIHTNLQCAYRANPGHPMSLLFDQVLPVRMFDAEEEYDSDGDFADPSQDMTFEDLEEGPGRNPIKPNTIE